jgi:hypothetical protein
MNETYNLIYKQIACFGLKIMCPFVSCSVMKCSLFAQPVQSLLFSDYVLLFYLAELHSTDHFQ